MDLHKLTKELEDLAYRIGIIKKECEECGYMFGDREIPGADLTDPEENFLSHELAALLDDFIMAGYTAEYLASPVIRTGRLYKNHEGRYAIGEYYFTSGDWLEVLVPLDEKDENSIYVWRCGYMTSSPRLDTEYCFSGAPNYPLDGAMARYR